MYHFLLPLHMSALKMTKVGWLAESMQNSLNHSPENTFFIQESHSLSLDSSPPFQCSYLEHMVSYLEPRILT